MTFYVLSTNSVVSAYKRKDPREADEVEVMSNCFDCLCSALSESSVKTSFVDGEGVELMLIMLKYAILFNWDRERRMSRGYALKVLDHAMSGFGGRECCIRFMDSGGLKRLFPIFLGQGMKSYTATYKEFSESKDFEHTISVMVSLFRFAQGAYRDRITTKFSENHGEKLDRLVTCCRVYSLRVEIVESEFVDLPSEERDTDIEYLKRLDAGLYTLQMISLIIAILYLEVLQDGSFKVC